MVAAMLHNSNFIGIFFALSMIASLSYFYNTSWVFGTLYCTFNIYSYVYKYKCVKQDEKKTVVFGSQLYTFAETSA